MKPITIDHQEYHHQKDRDGADILTYYDEGCQKLVRLKFPQESHEDSSGRIIEILSDVFIADLLSADD